MDFNCYFCTELQIKIIMNTISIDKNLYNYVSRCAKRSSMDVNVFVESILKYGLNELYSISDDNIGLNDRKSVLDKEALVAAAEYAISECDSGNGFVNDDIESVIANRRGWK